jgi:formylmethanofuran dehydrogenase subunit E
MMSAEEKNALVEKIWDFHTKKAPGIVIGIDMVELALEKLGPVKDKINAICEGQSCLIDVLQVMAGCTYGNKYLRVIESLGRYAFTLFDRFDGKGIRVFIDIDRIDPDETPELAKFFTRTRSPEVKEGGPARAESALKIIGEFAGVRQKIIGWYPVKVFDHHKPPMYPAALCEECNESFLLVEPGAKKCVECKGEVKYYEKI